MSGSAELDLAWLPDHSIGGSSALFKSALTDALGDPQYKTMELYYYAASVAGWNLIAPAIASWRAAAAGRTVRAWIGVDDAASDPEAFRKMMAAGIELSLPVRYSGTYHPKLIVLTGGKGGRALVGSHNLSNAALSKNFEVAVAVSFKGAPPAELADWMALVRAASDEATAALVNSYEKERDKFRKKHPAPSFTWSKRRASVGKPAAPAVLAATGGALVMEIAQLETGSGGKQIQPPMKVLTPFFGLPNQKPVSKLVKARLKGAPAFEDRTVRRNSNSTGRTHIPELDYDDRPCFMVFTRTPAGFEYEIVSQAREPSRYAALAEAAVNQANSKARRWVVTDQDILT